MRTAERCSLRIHIALALCWDSHKRRYCFEAGLRPLVRRRMKQSAILRFQLSAVLETVKKTTGGSECRATARDGAAAHRRCSPTPGCTLRARCSRDLAVCRAAEAWQKPWGFSGFTDTQKRNRKKQLKQVSEVAVSTWLSAFAASLDEAVACGVMPCNLCILLPSLLAGA